MSHSVIKGTLLTYQSSFLRRNWFLERVLKLGLVNVAKEYQCVRYFLFSSWSMINKWSDLETLQCSTCPDSAQCARLLDEKWNQAYKACFRFGPCQPSMVYRYLRGLEGVTPPLALTNLACQTHAKAFTITRASNFLHFPNRDIDFDFDNISVWSYVFSWGPGEW